MGESSLYETDILAWSEQQSAVLRRLKERRDLPNELDLENVADEVEDVGRSELHAVESLLLNILVHLILLWAEPDSSVVRGWVAEIAAWNVMVARRITPSMRAKIDLSSLWQDATKVTAAKLVGSADGTRFESRLSPLPCPFLLDDLLNRNLDPIALIPARSLPSLRGGA